jgi:hypothetical protein
MTDDLSYRLSEANDLPGLLALWEAAGWGSLTPELWRSWFVDGPHGAYLVAVALDACGEVVAQEMFAPSRVVVDGREVRALRFSAPIMREDRRGTSLRQEVHPLVRLYKLAADAAADRGYSLVYSLPDSAWMPIFRIAPRFGVPAFAESSYACVALPLDPNSESGAAELAAGYSAALVSDFGEEYDELWAVARRDLPIACGVVRDREWVRFRNTGRIAIEVRDGGDGSLVGYSATKTQTGLLADVLARTREELRVVVAVTARWLGSERGRALAPSLTHLKAMRTPFLAEALDALGFAPDDYSFSFACNTFDEDLPLRAIAAERWYVTPGD